MTRSAFSHFDFVLIFLRFYPEIKKPLFLFRFVNNVPYYTLACPGILIDRVYPYVYSDTVLQPAFCPQQGCRLEQD